MIRTTFEKHSDWKNGFLFVGNQLTLDFLNTRPIQNGEETELLPDFAALLRWFQASHLLSSREATNLQRQWGSTSRTHDTLQAIRQLRERLRAEILLWERGAGVHAAVINELNRLMAEHPMHTGLKASGKEFVTHLYFAAGKPEDLFAPLAYSAAMLFSQVDRKRVRKCDHCVLHFHDTSKKGTRRWCSMQMCGNRFKVAAYAARHRQQRS